MLLYRYTLFVLLLNLQVYATTISLQSDTLDTPRERIHSARKAIDSITNMQDKEVTVVESLKSMFEDAKTSGQVKIMHGAYDFKKRGTDDTFSTAIGGILKYELASLNGFNAGVGVYTAHDIAFATAQGVNHNSELSSEKGSYTEVAEAYLNYKYNNFNLRLGRQSLSTPLADSDEIRIIPNSFEAYVLEYKNQNFSFLIGNIQSWQGFDAGLQEPWQNTGTNGTNFIGTTYKDLWEFNAWAYNITNNTNALYLDGGIEYQISETLLLHSVLQYLLQNELDSSGTQATIYGGLFELVIHGLGFNIAYDKALVSQNKSSFSGFGGGMLFTSMDTMILDEIAQNENAEAFTYGLSYDINNFNLLYANGNFWSQTQAIQEQNMQIEYNFNDEFLIAGIYAITEDKKQSSKTDYDWDRFQLLINYNF